MNRFAVAVLALVPGASLSAQNDEVVDMSSTEDVVHMSTMHVYGMVPANDTPSAGFATTVTALQFQPSVDVQSRGFAETQCDVAIRGGVFENSGFKISAVNLQDPQTGHYFSEIPIDPMMLGAPRILTGYDNAMNGYNASVGTVNYGWQPIGDNGTIEVGGGTDSLFFSRFVTGYKTPDNYFLGRSVALQVTSSYSRGDGTVDNGDFRFQRFGARLQLQGQGGQTDLYAGYQKKNYGWPGMYTGNASYDEGDKYEVGLAILNHTQNYGEDSHWSVGAYGRQFIDDYDLKRSVPNFYRPYLHTTKVGGAAIEGEHRFSENWNLDWRAETSSDSIKSTDLTYGRFMSRSYMKTSAALGRQIAVGTGEILIQAGAAYDDTNRDSDKTSPLGRITYSKAVAGGLFSIYTEASRATQVASYTAIASKPAPASFAGDPNLPREIADNYEVGASWNRNAFTVGGNLFYRDHDDLVDWIYDSTAKQTFRTAAAMHLKVKGSELYTQWTPSQALTLVTSYAYLESSPDYGSANADASYYAMNYPRHRVATSVRWTIVKGLEFRVDGEARHQERNARRTSGNDALLVNASLAWTPEWGRGATIALLVDNATDSDFQSFPGTPASGRAAALRVSYVW
jgi:hypothetical protein